MLFLSPGGEHGTCWCHVLEGWVVVVVVGGAVSSVWITVLLSTYLMAARYAWLSHLPGGKVIGLPLQNETSAHTHTHLTKKVTKKHKLLWDSLIIHRLIYHSLQERCGGRLEQQSHLIYGRFMNGEAWKQPGWPGSCLRARVWTELLHTWTIISRAGHVSAHRAAPAELTWQREGRSER